MFYNLLQDLIEERDRLNSCYEIEKYYMPVIYLHKMEIKIKMLNKIITFLNKIQ